MNVSRESIYAALFAPIQALKDAGVIIGCSRNLKHWQDLDAAQQPFVCMVQAPEKGEYRFGTGVPTKWRGQVIFVVYVNSANDSEFVRATKLNEIVDAIEQAFSPHNADGSLKSDVVDMRYTLGGLVHDCRCCGDVESDDGTLGAQSVVTVPVEFQV